jgi:hypothetical protein
MKIIRLFFENISMEFKVQRGRALYDKMEFDEW